MIIFRVLAGVLGLLLILFGTVAAISPIPFGVVFVFIGLILLGIVAPPTRPWLRGLRRRWGWLDDRLDEAQEVWPEPIAKPLRESDPCEEEKTKP